MRPDRFDEVISAFNLVLDHKAEDQPGMIEDMRRQDPELCLEVEKLLRQSAATWSFGRKPSETESPGVPPAEKSTATINATNQQWERILELFQAAVKKSKVERPGFLEAVCAAEPEVCAEVKRRVSEYEKAEHEKPGSPVMFGGGEVLAGRFRVKRLLGVGGMGEVYEATDLVLRETVALKTVRFDIASDERMKSRFAQEVYAARKIAHPNICRIHDLHQHEVAGSLPIIFLTMELVKGETVAARLRRAGPMNLPDARLIAEQLIAALTAAHRAGVIHRDFKSANVILTASPDDGVRAVVTDFGLARSLHESDRGDSLTESGKIVGTPAYMAPEQLLGGPITAAVDIYALGVVLYEMVTGTRPAKALPSPRLLRPDLPIEWERAIIGCLEREPANRIPRAQDVWTAITADGQAPAATAGAPAKTRIRAAAASVVGAAILVSALIGAWFLGRHRPPAEAVRWYDDGTRALRDGLSFTAMNAFERAVKLDPEFTLAHARLAEAATELDYMDRAKSEMLLASPPAYQSLFLSREEKLRLSAVYLALVKDFGGAAAKYKELAAKVGGAERPAVLVDLGRAYESAGKIPEALASYSESAERDRQYAAAFMRRGILEAKQQQSAKAAADLDVAEQLYRIEGKSEGMTELLYQRSSLLRRVGKSKEALAPNEKALEMARSTGDEYHQIRALLALSNMSSSAGDTEGAKQQAQEAIDLARRAGIDVLAASGLVDMGNALFTKGDYAAAERYFRDAIEAARRFQAMRVIARAELPLGQLLANEGRTAEALAVSKQAVDDFEQVGEKSSAARARIPFFALVRDQGNYDYAADLYRQQLQSAEQVKDEGGIAFAVQGLGAVLLTQEQYPAALGFLERSLTVSHAIGDQSVEGWSYVYRADALCHLGRYQDAAESLKNAEVLARHLGGNKPLLASADGAQAEMKLSQLHFKESDQATRLALEESGQTASAIAIANRRLGLIRVSTGRAREGLALCEASLHKAQETLDIGLVKEAELALAEAKLQTGDLGGARSTATALAAYFASKRQSESELRALTLAAAASQGDDRAKFADAAKTALEKLRQSLAEAFPGFVARPDINVVLRRAGLISGTR
jgi:serine/threonine protein kinase